MTAAAPLLVRGRVLDARGHAVAGATLAWAGGPVPVPDVALLTGPDGRFVMTAPAPGRWRLACRSETLGHAEVELELGSADTQVTLTLPG